MGHNQLLETLNCVDNCGERNREVVTEANNWRFLLSKQVVPACARQMLVSELVDALLRHTTGRLRTDSALDRDAGGSYDPYCLLCVGCEADLKVIWERDDIAAGIYDFLLL